MTAGVVSGIGHVSLRTSEFERCVVQARRLMGLAESAQDDGVVSLTEGSAHHSLQYVADATSAVDHVGLQAPDHEALEVLRQRLTSRDIPFIEGTDSLLTDAIRFITPDGFTFEVYVEMARVAPKPSGEGVKPVRLGHVTLRATDPAQLTSFLTEVMDFRLSDTVAGGYFLRCNVDHHGLAVLPGERAVLHHHAWEVANVADLARVADRLRELDLDVLWGPVRHGAGNNVAVYFRDPCGVIVEYYCEMERIYDEMAFELREWDVQSQNWYSLWAPGLPNGFRDLGVPPAAQPVVAGDS